MTTTTPRRDWAQSPLDRWRASSPNPSTEFGPIETASAAMVRALLRDQPDLMQANSPGRITILRLSSVEWVTPIQDAWVSEFHGSADAPIEDPLPDDADRSHEQEASHGPSWFCFTNDGSTRERDPLALRRRVALALHSGKPIYAFSPDPDGLLPPALVRLADRIVTLPELSPEVLAEVLNLLTGSLPSVPISAALARATGPSEISLAWRPGETADGVLARLNRVLGPAAARAPEKDRLEDLLGMDEARNWGLAVVRDLPDYRAGRLRWADLDHAVLLAGPSGCGKTTFARRLATSAALPLITGSPQVWQGSREGHLGHALAAMQATFRQARAAAPCVLFIDEIDSMGSRATYADNQRDYSTAYMNGLLEELDGVNVMEGVIVIAACNHPSRLDPALIRAGRLNRVLQIDYPDEFALAGMLRQKLGDDLPDADLSLVVRHVRQATGADLEAWVRGARSRARHEGRPLLLDDLLVQVRPPGQNLSPPMQRRAAVHEAGHAVVGWLDRPRSIVRLSISYGPDSGGYVRSTQEDSLFTRAALERRLRCLLAGRAAEEILCGEPSSGAGGAEESDLAKATMLSVTALASWGLGRSQPLLWRGAPTATGVHATLAQDPMLAREVNALLTRTHQDAHAMLTANLPSLTRVVDALLARETLGCDELADLITLPDVLNNQPAQAQEAPW
ncbi:MAG: AAA family ATPase [Roseomonas sp.]|nr:AAA family ATPase [Roseomonas sp.]